MKRRMKLPILILLIVSIFALFFSFAINSPIKTFITNQKEVKAPANWYTDFTYDLDNTNKTITLEKYNGSASEVVVGASATIGGVRYQTIIKGNSNNPENSLFSYNTNITKITFEDGVIAAANMAYMFSDCENLVEVKFNNIDTTNTTNMVQLFRNCVSLETVDLNKLDTKKVTSFNGMFYNCESLETIDVSNFDTSSAKSFTNMFNGCKAVQTLDLSKFNTTEVKNMKNMLAGTSSLTELDISQFDTSHLENDGMYYFTHGSPIQKIKIGPKTDFHVHDTLKGEPFMRGICKKLETGEEIDCVDMFKLTSSQDMSGTYVRETSIINEMVPDSPVTLRIGKMTQIDEFTASSPLFGHTDRIIYLKDVSRPTISDYNVPGYVEVLFRNIVTDVDGNTYNLKVRIDNIWLYDFEDLPVDTFQVRLMSVSTLGLNFHAYDSKTIDAKQDLPAKDIKFDTTFQVVDDAGVPVNGNYIFSAYDMDINSNRDANGTPPGYGENSEGVNIYYGIDTNSIITHPDTYLTTYFNPSGNYYRITGTRTDEGTEYSEFLGIASASGTKMAYTGRNCSTTILAYYQPRIVKIEKQDSKGNTLPGANLQLYKNDGTEVFESWVSSTASEQLFLNPGKYKVEETGAPLGYDISGEITFYADINDQLTLNGDTVEKIIVTNQELPAKLIVKYVDENEDDIDSTKNIDEDVYWWDSYTTEQLDFTNYDFVEQTGDDPEGTIDKDEVEVIYHYALKDAKLIVKYVDETGDDIDVDENRDEDVHYGDSYTSEQKTFTNYDFVEQTGDATSGTIDKDEVEVIYHYVRKEATLVVKYVDQDNQDIDSTKNRNESVNWGDSYSSEQLTFTNYDFVEQTGDNPNGTIAKDSYEIIYHYQIKDATLTIKYVDENGEDIDPSVNIIDEPAYWGDAYFATQLIFGNYNFVERTGDAPSGIIAKEHVEVIYHYAHKPASLVVKYVDENNHDIDPTKNRNESVHYGDSYTSSQLTFTNYNFVNQTGDTASGTIAKDYVEVIYHYARKEATLVVKYVDENNHDIDPTKNRNESVHYGDTYNSSQLTFANYAFVELTGDAPNGTISKDSYEIIYHYALSEATLVVRYVDQDGYDIDITKNRNESVHFGDSYTSSQLTFTNYDFVERTGDPASGTINKNLVEVIYHYALKEATLTIKYVDQDNNSIDPTKDTINAPKHWGDSYSSSQLTFANYDFVEQTGDTPSGTIAKDHVEVIYHYALKPATLIVKYVDQDNHDIDPTKNRNEAVHYGDAYASIQYSFGNYNFVERTGDAASGIIAKDTVEIIYHYELKDATLTIKYVDQDDNDIDPTKNTINAPKHWGDSYTSSQLTFTNYNFVERTGDPASGTISKDHVEVIYHYELKDATLTIKYVDQEGHSIDPTKDTINAPKHWGDSYSSSQLTFTNYNFVERTGDAASGTIDKDHVEVIYHYALKDATLTIKYVDQDGHDIDPSVNTINAPKHWGDAYASTQLIFGNYNFVERTGDAPSGTIAKDHVEVIYHYALKPATLVVRYVDQNNHNIDPTKNRNESVHYGDSYTSSQLTFTNYNFVERTGDAASGTISKDSYEIIYHYTLKDATLTIKYVDQDGNDIDANQNIINAPKHWGDTYTSSQLTFTNYDFVERTGEPASGTIAKDHVEVIYHYELKDATLTIKYVDQDGNDIDPTKNTINAPKHWGDAYASTQLIFVNYNFVEQTGDDPSGIIAKDHVEVIYHYQIKDATLTIKYVDENGNSIDPTKDTINASKHWGDIYNSSQLTFANYIFVRVTGDAPNGTISKDHVEVIYHYRLCEAVLVVKYVDQDGYDIDITKNRNEEVHYGDTYTSDQLTFANYNFVEQTGDAPNGTINKDLVEVIYHYALKPATLVVKYVDQDNHDIDPTKNRNESVHWGDAYTSTMLTFTNYNFVNRTGDPASGTIAKDHVEVIYHYDLKPATLVVKYVDENGDDIDPTKNRNESVHYGDSYTSSQLSFANYAFVNRTGDPASGTINKDSYEIIYHYKLSEATLIVKYVDQDGNDIDPTKNRNEGVHWGDAYTSSQLTFTNYNFVNQTGDSASGTINKGLVEVIYHYVLKPATLTIKYVDQNSNSIDPTKDTINASKHWGDSYSSEQLTFTNYNFVERTGDPASGTIAKDHVEVIYHYSLKSADLVVKYVDANGDNIDSSKNRNESFHWGDTYTSEQYTFENYDFVNRTGDAASGTISKDNYEIIYHYKLKKGTVITHHYLYNNGETTTKLADDVSNTYDYTTTYNTEASADVPLNYELFKKSTNFTGIVNSPTIDVYYYYQLKDSNLETTISKVGPKEITDKNAKLDYTITYSANISEYIGDGTVTIIDHLPLEIEESVSNLDGGTYDSGDKTITWTENITDINTYNESNSVKKITITKNISLKYKGITGKERVLINSVNGKIVLSNKNREVENQSSTDVKITGKITVRYVDEDDNDLLDKIEETGLIGDAFNSEEKEIEGYRLIKKPTSEHLEFTEEEQEIKYIYQEIIYKVITKAKEGGSIVGDEDVPYGKDSTKDKIVINAEEGYVIEEVYVNGVKLEIKPNQNKLILNQFLSMKEDKLVEVTFVKKTAIVNPPTGSTLNILLFIITLILSIIIVRNGTKLNLMQKGEK